MAALKQQFEQLKEAGAAKKAELTKARKAAIAKAVEERTKIVEKAEALASSLDDEINWRSTADKFRSLFDQWQQHQRTSVHIDKPQADALWKRFSAARTTFQRGPPQVVAGPRRRARPCQGRERGDHRRGEPAEGLDRMGRDLAPVQRVDGPLEAGRLRRPQR